MRPQFRPSSFAAGAGGGLGAAISNTVVWIVEAAGHIDVPETVELGWVVIFTAIVSAIGAALAPPRE